jgi:hypothetical protein
MSISAMKQALEALNYIYCPTTEYQDEVMEAALYALRQAIAEAEKQEPVYVDSSRFPKDSLEYKPGMTVTKPKQQEDWYGQHQWQCGYERGWDKAMEHKREWVGLSHEERDEIDQNCKSQMQTIFATEAKLKEKNT